MNFNRKDLMNKKGQATIEFLMTYGWAFMAAIIAIGILAYFGVNGFEIEPKFKITKEECRNESKIIDYKEIGRTEGGIFYSPIYIFEEVCEQVEVNEIRGMGKRNQDEFIKCLERDSNVDTSVYYYFCDHISSWIKKQDLSIEWLDSNCLVGVNCDLTFEHNCEGYAKMDEAEKMTKVIMKNKYKCQDYTVEVIK